MFSNKCVYIKTSLKGKPIFFRILSLYLKTNQLVQNTLHVYSRFAKFVTKWSKVYNYLTNNYYEGRVPHKIFEQILEIELQRYPRAQWPSLLYRAVCMIFFPYKLSCFKDSQQQFSHGYFILRDFRNAPFYIHCLFHMINLRMFSLSFFIFLQNGL